MLFDINLSILWGLFAWNIVLYFFILSLSLPLLFKCIFYKEQRVGFSGPFSHSGFLIGAFKTLILIEIIIIEFCNILERSLAFYWDIFCLNVAFLALHVEMILSSRNFWAVVYLWISLYFLKMWMNTFLVKYSWEGIHFIESFKKISSTVFRPIGSCVMICCIYYIN